VKNIKLLAVQLVITAAASYLGALSLYAGALLHDVCVWMLLPVLGAATSYMITVRGVNNYLAWMIPPIAGIAAHYLAFFYLPDTPGPFLACAFVSIVGAAAGDVVKKRSKSK